MLKISLLNYNDGFLELNFGQNSKNNGQNFKNNGQNSKKKGHRCDPTFVNLKSNTMKNTMQNYAVLLSDANFFHCFSYNLQYN
jgi:hypothetical protein